MHQLHGIRKKISSFCSSETSTHETRAPTLRFGNPKAARRGYFNSFSSHLFSSPLMSLQFCGMWWSLRIMFPSRYYSSLNLICIFPKANEITISDLSLQSWVFFSLPRAIRFCAHSVDRKPYTHIKWMLFPLANFSPWLLYAMCNCHHLTLSSLFFPHCKIKKLRYIYSLNSLLL